MAIYICPSCGQGVSTGEFHECKRESKYFKTKIDDVPEHVKNYGKHKFTYTYKGENRPRAWF